MSVKTTAIIIGTVARVNTREGISKKTNEPWSMTNILVIGNDTLADVQLGRDLGTPKVGALIAGRVAISVFADDDQMVLETYLDPATLMAPAKS